MRNLIIITMVAVVLSPIRLSALTTFDRWYDAAISGYGQQVIPTADRGYLVVGTNYNTDSDIWLVKVDSVGDTLWTRTYNGGGTNDYGVALVQSADGGYVIYGYKYILDVVGDLWLLKTDSHGDTQWTRTYGGAAYDLAGYSVIQTTDGGYAMIGRTMSYGAGSMDMWLVKTDADGNMVWNRTYGGANEEWGNGLAQTSDGGYIIVGFTKSYGAGHNDLYLVKTDADGDTLWTSVYGGFDDDAGYFVSPTTDGGYIVIGRTFSLGNPPGQADIWLVKADSQGHVIWYKTYGSSLLEAAVSGGQSDDGGYYIGGYFYVSAEKKWDFWLAKTDANGDTLWTRTYGGINNDFGYSVVNTTDGGYIMTGITWSFEPGKANLYILKTDAAGYINIDENKDGQKPGPADADLLVYPNPFTRSTNISFSFSESGSDAAVLNMSIYGLDGRLVKDLAMSPGSPVQHRVVTWDGKDNTGRQVEPGIYFVRLKMGERFVTGKIILVKEP